MKPSHPSRGAWIEMAGRATAHRKGRRTPHGVRGLKCLTVGGVTTVAPSHPSRGAWIEIPAGDRARLDSRVAPLTGCVD